MEYNLFSTKFGSLRLRPSSYDHIFVASEGEYKSEPFYILVNGVEYRIMAHLHLWKDKKYHIGEEHNPSIHNLSINRRGSYSDGATTSARKKIAEAIEEAVNLWVSHFPEVMKAAELENLQDTQEKTQKKIDELMSELHTLDETMETLRVKIDTLRGE